MARIGRKALEARRGKAKKLIRLRQALRRRVGFRKAEKLEQVMGKERFPIVAKHFLKYFTEKIEKQERRAQAKVSAILKRQGLSPRQRNRIRIQSRPAFAREGAEVRQIGKTSWWNVYIRGQISKKVQGKKNAERQAKKFEHQKDLLALERQYGLSRKEARSFSAGIRREESRLYKRLLGEVKKIKEPTRRKKVRRALRLGRLKGGAVNWQINFILKVLTSE